ncbi:MAG: EAL domain-containing protein [Pseudomonadota bacterium]
MSGLVELMLHPALAVGVPVGALLGLVFRPLIWPADKGDVNSDVLRRENERLRRDARAPAMVAGHSPDGLLIQDLRGRIEWANPAFTEITGWPLDEILGRRPQEFLLPLDVRPTAREVARFRYDPSSDLFEGFQTVEQVTREGERFWSQLGFALVESPDREEEGRVVVSLRDVTDNMEELEAAQNVSQEWTLFRGALSVTNDALLLQDIQGRVEWASPALRRMTGYGLEELRGRHPDGVILQPGKPVDPAALEAFRFDLAKPEFRLNRINEIVLRTGGSAWIEIRHFRHEISGLGEHVLSVWRDVTELVKRETELQHLKDELHQLTRIDIVTGLANRASLTDFLAQTLARAAETNGRTALIHLDLEQFKEVNDTLGLAAGDAVLREVAKRISSLLGENSMVARASGDEFLIVRADVSSAHAVLSEVETLGELLCKPMNWRGCRVRLGVRFGIAVSEPGQYQSSRLLQQADIALNHARPAGQTALVYDEALGARHFERQSLLSDLAQASTQAQFELHYQPQFDLAAGQVAALEGLMRWRHPDRGVLAPGEFFALAREAGIMEDIDLAAMTTGVDALPSLRAALGNDVRLALNVGRATLARTDYLERLSDELLRRGLLASDVALELGDVVAPEDTDLLQRAAEAGYPLVLDEFGMGSAGLGALSALPISGLKIDARLVRSMTAGDPNASVIRAIIGLCDELTIDVVVSGVSDAAHVPLVRAMGAHTVQGFALAPPMPAAGIADWAAREDLSVSGGG